MYVVPSGSVTGVAPYGSLKSRPTLDATSEQRAPALAVMVAPATATVGSATRVAVSAPINRAGTRTRGTHAGRRIATPDRPASLSSVIASAAAASSVRPASAY